MLVDTPYLRPIIFMTLLLLLAVFEILYPRQECVQDKWRRWFTNISLVLISSVFLRLLATVGTVAVAYYAMNQNVGLLNWLPLPYYLDIAIGIVFLDLAIYLQHVCTHKFALLWRFHKVHHCDRDVDVTTAIRFHPIEILLSMVYKICIILLLGPLPLCIILFEILLNASAMFNHANIKLAKIVNKCLRSVIVTPDMHRIHHSVARQETDSNYGFFLSVWDRLFKTYTKEPKAGYQKIKIGLPQWQTNQTSKLGWLLMLPFKSENHK